MDPVVETVLHGIIRVARAATDSPIVSGTATDGPLVWDATDGPIVAGAATDGPLVWDVTDVPIVGVATLPVWVNKRGGATIVAGPRIAAMHEWPCAS